MGKPRGPAWRRAKSSPTLDWPTTTASSVVASPPAAGASSRPAGSVDRRGLPFVAEGHRLAVDDRSQLFGGQAAPDEPARQAGTESLRQADTGGLAEVPEKVPQPVDAVRLEGTGVV